MGLHVLLNVQVDQIDPERWEAVWLTSLQLLEHFPGPLAAHVLDERHESRYVLTPQIQFASGTKEEHWKVNGELGSGRMGETYCLYRHLAHYRRQARRRRRGESPDILWLPAKDIEGGGEVGGLGLFGAKSQGFPYHYAILAVALLVENSFPGRALAYGDISRIQSEQIVPWAEAILGRPLRLPVVTEGPRLWRRLAEVYAGAPELAVRRFLSLCSERGYSAWRALLPLEDGPEAAVLRGVCHSELASIRAYASAAPRRWSPPSVKRTAAWNACSTGPVARLLMIKSVAGLRRRSFWNACAICWCRFPPTSAKCWTC